MKWWDLWKKEVNVCIMFVCSLKSRLSWAVSHFYSLLSASAAADQQSVTVHWSSICMFICVCTRVCLCDCPLVRPVWPVSARPGRTVAFCLSRLISSPLIDPSLSPLKPALSSCHRTDNGFSGTSQHQASPPSCNYTANVPISKTFLWDLQFLADHHQNGKVFGKIWLLFWRV